jgi:hypothetical protein
VGSLSSLSAASVSVLASTVALTANASLAPEFANPGKKSFCTNPPPPPLPVVSVVPVAESSGDDLVVILLEVAGTDFYSSITTENTQLATKHTIVLLLNKSCQILLFHFLVLLEQSALQGNTFGFRLSQSFNE